MEGDLLFKKYFFIKLKWIMSNRIEKLFEESISVKKEILSSNVLESLELIGNQIVDSMLKGNKLMLCGNGGSAADAQHLAAELLVRLRPNFNRKGIPAISLAQDTSTLTACGNDFGYQHIFSRNLEALGNKGDCLLCITTSGNSENIILAMEEAKKNDIKTFAFLGGDGGKCIDLCDNFFLVPSSSTGRIQESHITAGHALMEYIEDALLEKKFISLK